MIKDLLTATSVRNREIPLKTVDGWYQLAPIGDAPGIIEDGQDRKHVTQALNRATLSAVVKAFAEKLLVDFEHRSTMPDGDTAAAGWISNVQMRDDGLWGQFVWTDSGEAAVANQRYRYLSPVFTVELSNDGKTAVPVALQSVGLTNRPNLKGLRPLSNKDTEATAAASNSAASGGEKGSMDYKAMILTILGLPAEADDAAIQAALDAKAAKTEDDKKTAGEVMNRATAAEAEVVTLKAKLLDNEADVFIAANADKISDTAKAKALYVANKDAFLASLSLFRSQPVQAAVPGKVVINKAEMKTPVNADGKTGDEVAAAQKSAVDAIAVKNKCSMAQAYAIAATNHPELFRA